VAFHPTDTQVAIAQYNNSDVERVQTNYEGDPGTLSGFSGPDKRLYSLQVSDMSFVLPQAGLNPLAPKKVLQAKHAQQLVPPIPRSHGSSWHRASTGVSRKYSRGLSQQQRPHPGDPGRRPGICHGLRRLVRGNQGLPRGSLAARQGFRASGVFCACDPIK
jgi:hypothetical protein